MKFETIEAAQTAYDKLKESFDKQELALKSAIEEKKTAESTALEAIEKANLTPEDFKKTIIKIGAVKYEIVFGVDGLTKEELAKDSKKLAKLEKIGSGALVKLEDK